MSNDIINRTDSQSKSQYFEDLLETSDLLQSLRLSNAPPSDEQSKCIHLDVLPRIHENLGQTTDFAQTNTLSMSTTRYRALTSSIRTFPAEILCEIFQYACFSLQQYYESTCGTSPVATLEANAPHWVLSRVSGYWRETMISCPVIWSTFYIKPCHDNSSALKQRFDIALERSGQYPIDMVFVFDDYYNTPGGWYDMVQYMFARLCSASARWRRVVLSLEYASEHAMKAIFSTAQPGSRFSLLRELTISEGSFRHCFPFPSPTLRCATLCSAPVHRLLPWEQLTTLHFVVPETEATVTPEYLDALTAAQSVTSLTLFTKRTYDSRNLYPPNPRIVTMTSVRTLCIDGMIFIQHLSLPGLTDLHLTRYPSVDGTIKLFLSRSECTLASLHVEKLVGQDVLMILSSDGMGRLSTLIIRGSSRPTWPRPDDRTADVLTVLSRMACEPYSFLPYLTDVAIHFDVAEEELPDFGKYSKIWGMLEDRGRMGLKNFQLVVHPQKAGRYESIRSGFDPDSKKMRWMARYEPYESPAGMQERLRDLGLHASVLAMITGQPGLDWVEEEEEEKEEEGEAYRTRRGWPSFRYDSRNDICPVCL